jgi:hypothetical protein
LNLGGSFWKELFARLPDAFYPVAALILLLIMIAVLWWVSIGAKRFSESMGRENRLITLQDEMIKEKKENQDNADTALQVSRALENARMYINSLNNLRMSADPTTAELRSKQLIQRIVESLASDVKFRPGERHRCGLWLEIEEANKLTLLFGSTGFPDNYVNQRILDINQSIAGKAYRKKQTVKRDIVSEDDDWERNPHSSSDYTALICIPIKAWGVLTIDALEPMKHEALLIGELYATIIEGALEEYIMSVEFINTHEGVS